MALCKCKVVITAVPPGSRQDCWAYCTEHQTKRKRTGLVQPEEENAARGP